MEFKDLDEEILPEIFRRKQSGKLLGVLGVVASGLIGLVSLCGVSRYNSWKNEYAYNQQYHIVAPRNFDVESADGANRALLDFPDETPGAKKIDKYLTPDAKYCLVHLRQKHLAENIDKKLKKKLLLFNLIFIGFYLIYMKIMD
ncbi:MAG: hypothetical protein Q8N99_00780 [Nanoarchaeota archaeon]|nr:hypothetical protein [Nanoarchaeota archaeon]